MVLGTAQLATHYGIANQTGIPARKEIFEILSMAWDYGIRRYDTAPAYGSEEILGEFVQANGLENSIKISTKISSIPDTGSTTAFTECFNRSIEESRVRLKAKIDVLYFHRGPDSAVIEKHIPFFHGLVQQNLVSNIGLSVYDPFELKGMSDLDLELAYQFPFNVVDTRFSAVRLPIGRRYVRSIFLQGFLSSSKFLRPYASKELSNFHKQYHAVLLKFSVSPVDYALSFVLSSAVADYYLIAVERPEQLSDILSSKSLGKKLLSDLANKLPRIDHRSRDPRNWSIE